MTTLVFSRLAVTERVYARLIAGTSVTDLAYQTSEEQLKRFPPQEWCRSQEANVAALNRLRDEAWDQKVRRLAASRSVAAGKLETLVSQMFVMSWGRRLATLRMCLAVVNRPVTLVSDLPRPLVAAFLPEFDGGLVEARWRSLPLRLLGALEASGRQQLRHLLRIARLLRLQRLPPRGADATSDYIAWLGVLPSEVKDRGEARLSLLEFLAEAREGLQNLQVMLQGARVVRLPAGFLHRQFVPALRFRPRWSEVFKAVSEQIRQAISDLMRVADFRHNSLFGPATFDVPALRLWFHVDPPRGVFYANHQIGGESPAALMRSSVPSTMVFYSTNVAHRPENVNKPGTRLEPEMRYIVADHLMMWSPEMSGVFRTAGYASDRLIETGPLFFGRQGEFRSTSRYIAPPQGTGSQLAGPIRLGIFDVAVLTPERRFAMGFGLLTYNAAATRRFFEDVFSAAYEVFGRDVVIVRKMKRERSPIFSEDIDFRALPPLRLEARDPAESLWRVLEQVDLVVCMPFTSVAYLADECGIPAAYYEAGENFEPSPLGGRPPLISTRARLAEWFTAPGRPVARVPPMVAARAIASSIGPVLSPCPSQS